MNYIRTLMRTEAGDTQFETMQDLSRYYKVSQPKICALLQKRGLMEKRDGRWHPTKKACEYVPDIVRYTKRKKQAWGKITYYWRENYVKKLIEDIR